ncbi:GNAT family N-acetyltransferase [Phenylobacterium immobile]|uniref:GNAT family N-acetyltransferase n=1 Tax=Phenylobacterium immobile TaxID=21 RepID=UPI000B2DBEED|nr:GNAT family N-acetyltransferase [Phenylobacterium immobile]
MTDLRDNGARYEIDEEGQTAYAEYRRETGRLYIDYVFSPPALRGKGTAGRLMTLVAEEARTHGLTITPICGYARTWLSRKPEYHDIVT